jgi:REP element-mobilizing transposase RayT
MPSKPYPWRQRRSPRLESYDYAEDGGYFITICTRHQLCLFGEIEDEAMHLNAAGQMVQSFWQMLAERYPTCELDVYVIMPNHLHGILFINNPPDDEVARIPVTRMMQWFKTVTTNSYIRGVKEQDWPRFPGHLWHRSFYDHIIRHDGSLARIREYIINNPLKWALDKLHPDQPDE